MSGFKFVAVALAISGCTEIPERFERGHRSIHPRFGVSITNETREHFDLEVIVLDYSFVYTAGEPQIERAKDVFLEVLRRHTKNNSLRIREVPRVELQASQVRNEIDGTNTTRIGKRIYIQTAPTSKTSNAVGAPR